jgi:hypothetical protein
MPVENKLGSVIMRWSAMEVFSLIAESFCYVVASYTKRQVSLLNPTVI